MSKYGMGGCSICKKFQPLKDGKCLECTELSKTNLPDFFDKSSKKAKEEIKSEKIRWEEESEDKIVQTGNTKYLGTDFYGGKSILSWLKKYFCYGDRVKIKARKGAILIERID